MSISFLSKKVQIRTIVLFLLLIVLQAVIKNNFAHLPRYNWDALPYMALVLKMDGIENDSIRHAMVYQHAKDKMPASFYSENTDNDNKYRLIMKDDFKAFTEQMPLYSIKGFYISFVYLLYKLGVDLLTATYLPSLMAFYLIGWLIFFYTTIRINDIAAFAIVLLFSITPASLSVVALSSPDGLSAIFMVAGLLVLFQNKKSRWMTLWFLLAILSRRDNVLFVVLLYGLMLIHEWRAGENIRNRVLETVVFIFVYLSIGILSGNPGWKDTFMQSFAYKQPYFLSVDSGFTWEIYWDIIERVYIRLSNASAFYFLLGIILLWGPAGKGWPNYFMKMNFYQAVFLIMVMVNLIRFFLFPDIHDRFYFGYFSILCLLLIEAQKKRINE